MLESWRVLAIALLVSTAGTGGCTAAKANLQIAGAEAALRRAEEYDTAEHAAYQHTLAEAYLQKAKEEAGFSQYRIADALAKMSAEWSDRAIIFVEGRGRARIRLDDFSNDAAPKPEAPLTGSPLDPDEDL